MAKKEEKPDTIKQLFGYAGNYRYLTIASWVLATISAFVALVPFYFIWRLIKEVLRVAPDYGNAQNLSVYGWSAVAFAIGAMLIYIGALMCSHLSAFRIQANMRSKLMRHILTLPLGFMDEEGSGKVRKIVNESSAATETYIAHQLPDKCVATATPVGLALLLLVFDWATWTSVPYSGCNRIRSNELHDGRQHEKENGRVPECIGRKCQARRLSM